MADLLDLAPASEFVTVRGIQIETPGVSAKGLARLLSRFPDFRALVTGAQFETDKLLELGGDTVAAIIAAGIGHPGEAKYEKAAEALTLGEQADLLDAIKRVTMPQGIGPFVAKLSKLADITNENESGKNVQEAENSTATSLSIWPGRSSN